MKPLLRGHSYQAMFFVALGACSVLIAVSRTPKAELATMIYSASVLALFGVGAIYHRPYWTPEWRMRLRRLDYSVIFTMFGGTITPLCLLAMPAAAGARLLTAIWVATGVGVAQSLFWVQAPRWIAVILYVAISFYILPYLSEMQPALGPHLDLILMGGAAYTLGAFAFALRWPDPFPKVFGYHEIFHLLAIVGAICHFVVIARLVI